MILVLLFILFSFHESLLLRIELDIDQFYIIANHCELQSHVELTAWGHFA